MFGRDEINPEEILANTSVDGFDRERFEGRIERPLGRRASVVAGGVLAFFFIVLLARAGDLQIIRGTAYARQAQENQLREKIIFADRGVIADRTGMPLAWSERASVTDEFAQRAYATVAGLAHAVGYVKPPAKDSSGFYYRSSFIGLDGVEEAYNQELAGQSGKQLTETDAHGRVVSESAAEPAHAGQKIILSLDAKVTEGLYNAIAKRVQESGFVGGAGVIMDVQTGELLALTSYPEYSQTALMRGDKKTVAALTGDPRQPFLNRAISGLYAPGSIVKPIVAIAALTDGVINENKQILSTGSISVPNPYDKTRPSVFKDWRANGWVDARHAIAVSSDVYFYEVGGGFESQTGLGIDALEKYFQLFGFGRPTGLFGFSEPSGSIPSIVWKEQNFPGDPWRVGDTYHTAIGQYGLTITPLQAVREAVAIANNGWLLSPTLIASLGSTSSPQATPQKISLGLPEYNIKVAREGMRLGVTEGIAQSVNFSFVHVAAKTGTAQVGIRNQYLNSWMIGFWPYEHPRFAYAVVLERGPAGTTVGAPSAMNTFLQWMQTNAPEYLAND